MTTIKHRKVHYLVIRKPTESHWDRRTGKLVVREFKPFLCPLPKARVMAGHVLAIESCDFPHDPADMEDARLRADLSETAARLVMERYRSGKVSEAEREAAVQHSIRRAYGVMESVVSNGLHPRKAG